MASSKPVSALDTAALRGFLGDVHTHVEVAVRCVLAEHVQGTELAIGEAEELDDLWILHSPGSPDGRGDEATIPSLAHEFAGVELLHEMGQGNSTSPGLSSKRN